MVANSKLDKSDSKYKPLYLANDFDKVNRGIQKFMKRYNWHDPEAEAKDISWKSQIPLSLKKNGPNKGKSRQNRDRIPPTTVLFVPNSHGGLLL